MEKILSLDKLCSEKLVVLYIEDHDETREELTQLLETIFSKVIVAKNGYEGLELYNSCELDLIITDINMPVMDGITMIEKIREDNCEIKIIVFSAHEKIEYLSRCIELNVDGFLTKPLNQKKYFKTLYKVVEQIQIKKELAEYKSSLEKKVQEQLDEIVLKNNILEKNARLATMGEMIDAIAHQWKNPLTIISMYVDYMRINVQSDKLIKEKLLENFEKMDYQLKHLFETIDEFRSFFRPNTKLEKISINTLIESTLVLLKDDLIKYTIAVKQIYKDDFEILVNPNEFKHILINLIQNSKDAFIQNDIQNRTIYFDILKKDNNIEISICDNAGGIPNDLLDQVFSPNFTTKQEFSGTGVGLYLSKQILDKINGKINVENTNEGCCFKIVL